MIGKRRSKPKKKPVSTTPVPILEMESDWACLPEDLLILILHKLVSLSDYVRFTAVCMPWHSVALDKYRGERPLKLSMHQPPLLFLAHSAQPSSEGKTTFSIYNVSENKTFKLKTFIPCDRQSTYHYGDSYHGWMISVDEKYVISLSNPFCSKVKEADDYGIIRLSPFSPYCHTYNKVVLSADPIMAPDGYSVMVIYNNGHLAFTRPGDNKGWTCIERSCDFVDVIYSKAGLFYALDEFGSVKICDISDIGEKTSTYVSASDFPGCQPNSIYFTDCQNDTCFASNYDMSIFNLRDGSFQRNCVLKFLSTRKNIKKFMPYISGIVVVATMLDSANFSTGVSIVRSMRWLWNENTLVGGGTC